MLYIVIAAVLIIYLLTGVTTAENRLSINATKIIRVFVFVLAPIGILLITLSYFNIYPRGYWVTKVIFWVLIVLIMLLFGLGNKSVLNKIERVIYGCFFYAPLCYIPLLLIPFVGVGFLLLFYVSFVGDGSFILYADQNIRIEKQGIGFMGPPPYLEVYRKSGLFSYQDTLLGIEYMDKIDSLHVEQVNDSTYLLTHFAPDNWEVPEGKEQITFSIKRK